MYFATNDVHVPRFPHDRFRGKNPMIVRGDAIEQFDWSVGQLMKTLDEMGLTENTLIILSGDNGPVVDDGYADRAVGKGWAVLCNVSAAKLYGLKVLEESIEDNKHNFTRFLVVCNPRKVDFLRPLEKADKSSMVFARCAYMRRCCR